jgi:predicted dehydrogenase
MNSQKLRVAVIGVGHLGQAHARVLSALSDVELVGVADANTGQADQVAARHHTQAFTHFAPLLNQVDAACIVVPTCQHHAVATAFLEYGVHLLIEKPLAPSVEQADEMVKVAERNGCIVQVGHIERFNPAFESIAAKPIQPKLIECERHGPFTGRSADIGAVLDLMIHDLDLVCALDASAVIGVEAMGLSVFGGHEDMVKARLRLASGCVADLTACRIAPVPKRTMRIWSPEGFAGIDFMTRKLSLVQPSESLRQNGLNVAGFDAGVRDAIKAELFGKHLEQCEQVCESPLDQLTQELRHFVECVRRNRRPRVSAEDGRNAVALACRVLDSVRTHAWNGQAGGPQGPNDWPMPNGKLFGPSSRAAA